MPRKILTIINKNAGNFNTIEAKNLETILQVAPQLDSHVIKTDSLDDLYSKVGEYMRIHHQLPDILGIGSGDGGAHHILSLFANNYGIIPKTIAPFPIGTIINYATPFGITDGAIDKIKKKLRDKLLVDNSLRYNLLITKAEQLALYIMDNSLIDQPLHTSPLGVLNINGLRGFNTGFGIVPKFVWLYYGGTKEDYIAEINDFDIIKTIVIGNGDLFASKFTKKKGGFSSFMKTVSSAIFNAIIKPEIHEDFLFDSIEAEIYLDGKKVQENYFTGALFTTHECVGIGVNGIACKPAYRARSGVAQNKFQAVLTTMSAKQVLPYVPSLAAGKPIYHRGIIDEMVNAVEIAFAKPALIQIDGELMYSKKLILRYDSTVEIIHPFRKERISLF
ncbi:hypothetical protein HZA96_06375 [Candidatus Woesearchaeota archaeon]|nr:hypothetical protein [Candidatus Woesearchaeota archaeon]